MGILYYIVKVLLTTGLVILVSEIAKKNGILAGLFASVPIVSFLAIIWIYVETKNIRKIANLSNDIFWLVFPSLSFFIVFPILLNRNMRFGWAMLLSTLIMIILYTILILLLKRNWS